MLVISPMFSTSSFSSTVNIGVKSGVMNVLNRILGSMSTSASLSFSSRSVMRYPRFRRKVASIVDIRPRYQHA